MGDNEVRIKSEDAVKEIHKLVAHELMPKM